MLRLGTIVFLLMSLVTCGGNTPSEESSIQTESVPAGSSSETWFEVSGAANVRVDPASGRIFPNAADIVTLQVISDTAAIRELGRTYSANLFFAKEFDPQPGTYPIQFSYLGEANTLGGSFIGAEMFSHDTAGEAEFMEFGDQVRVRFRFTTYNASEGSANRQSVTVTGEAVCERGDAI